MICLDLNFIPILFLLKARDFDWINAVEDGSGNRVKIGAEIVGLDELSVVDVIVSRYIFVEAEGFLGREVRDVSLFSIIGWLRLRRVGLILSLSRVERLTALVFISALMTCRKISVLTNGQDEQF